MLWWLPINVEPTWNQSWINVYSMLIQRCVPSAGYILQKHTWHYIFVYNLYMFVSIWPCVFMPKPNHVTKLVHYNSKFITVFADANSLVTVATFTNKWTTPGKSKRDRKHLNKKIMRRKYNYGSFVCVHIVSFYTQPFHMSMTMYVYC